MIHWLCPIDDRNKVYIIFGFNTNWLKYQVHTSGRHIITVRVLSYKRPFQLELLKVLNFDVSPTVFSKQSDDRQS